MMLALLALLAALDPATLDKLARGDAAERSSAVSSLVAAGDPQALEVLRALLDGNLYAAEEGAPVIGEREGFEKVPINNRLRRELQKAIAVLKLSGPDAEERLGAVRELSDDPDALPAVDKALARESDARVREALEGARAVLRLSSPERGQRLAAIDELRKSPGASSKRQLLQRLPLEKDPQVLAALKSALDAVEGSLKRAELVGLVFGGLSMASILLLASLGLAITFGLMGVINMAHGELLMVGAYATWLVQSAMHGSAWYLVVAVPASFLAAALAGVLLEIAVVRRLYGRPLETLLATWGASLLMMQTVRTIFGAQNVEVGNPPWMSGGVPLLPGLVLPWNRIAIIGFALFVLLLVRMLLTRTRLGLLVRAVTQDRRRAAGLGVRTPRIDLLAFALGSGIAGLGGCALSQIGNVGPELGQGFIVDTFMVVVLGGVGQLSGALVASIALGITNKLLEPTAGAVMAKIVVLVFVIVFIQRRPQGFFALGGRASASEET